MPRDTQILTQDIADEQLIDTQPKTGSRLRTLVDKPILNFFYLQSVVISAPVTSIRLDQSLLGKTPSVGSGMGIMTSRKSAIFQGGKNKGVPDGSSNDVSGQMAFVASLTFSINMVFGNPVGTTVGNPGDVQIGDSVLIATPVPFLAVITNKVPNGPNFDLTFNSSFLLGSSGLYTATRISRWTMTFKDSANVTFTMPAQTLDLGILQRSFVSDTAESLALGLNPEQIPQTPGGGGGGGDIKSDGTVPFANDESMGNHKLTNLSNGTNPADGVNLSQMQAGDAATLAAADAFATAAAAAAQAAAESFATAGDVATLAAAEAFFTANDKYAPDRIVDPSGHGTDTTLATAIAALAATGGTIWVKGGTFVISTTITLPLKNIRIIGSGGNTVGPGVIEDATIFDLQANAIALFTTSTGGGGTDFASFYFSDFKVVGNGVAAQQFFKAPTLALGCAAIAERLHIEAVQDIINTQGQDVDFTFRDSVLNPTTATASFWNSPGSTGELTWDHVAASLPGPSTNAISGTPNWTVRYSYLGGPPMINPSIFVVNQIQWDGFFLGKNADKADVTIGGAASTIASCEFIGVTLHVNATLFFLTNSWFSNSAGATPTSQVEINGVGSVAEAVISNCIFSGFGAATHAVDVVNVTDVSITGCQSSGHTVDGIRASVSSTLSVSNCRFVEGTPVNETATTVTGRYGDNDGFTGSVIVGLNSVVEGARRKDVTGGNTTDGFVTVFTHLNAKGLLGIGAIKNTGANSLDVQQTVTDSFGVTSSSIIAVPAGNNQSLDEQLPIGTAFPAYVSYAVQVRSTTPGNPTTYNLRHTSHGAY